LTEQSKDKLQGLIDKAGAKVLKRGSIAGAAVRARGEKEAERIIQAVGSKAPPVYRRGPWHLARPGAYPLPPARLAFALASFMAWLFHRTTPGPDMVVTSSFTGSVGAGIVNVLVGLWTGSQRMGVRGFFAGCFIRGADGDVGAPGGEVRPDGTLKQLKVSLGLSFKRPTFASRKTLTWNSME